MKCITCQPLSSPLLSQCRHRHQFWHAFKPSSVGVNRVIGLSSGSVRTRALPCPVFIAAKLTDTGKLAVILQTGAVCLFAFWIANFVVPGIILKNLQSDSTNDDSEYSDEDE